MVDTSMFANVIGQDEPKRKLAFYLHSYNKTHIMPNLMLAAQKGQGKTLLATETAKQLVAFGEDGKPLMKEDGKTIKKKTFLEINASSIKSINAFVTQILAKKVVDRDVTVFIDEAHGLKKDVTQGLLTMLNPTPTHRTQYCHDDYVIDLDFRRQTFIFATSESQSVFDPLMDRLKRIDLQSYTLDDLAKIVAITVPDVNFKDGVLETISTVVRGNARQAVKMADDIRAYLCSKTEFGRKQWKDLCKILSIRPLGLSPIEVELLRFMYERPEGSSLTNLAARSGLSREAVQRDYESYLQHCGLMEITAGKGRNLTPKGVQYLKDLELYNLSLA